MLNKMVKEESVPVPSVLESEGLQLVYLFIGTFFIGVLTFFVIH